MKHDMLKNTDVKTNKILVQGHSNVLSHHVLTQKLEFLWHPLLSIEKYPSNIA